VCEDCKRESTNETQLHHLPLESRLTIANSQEEEHAASGHLSPTSLRDLLLTRVCGRSSVPIILRVHLCVHVSVLSQRATRLFLPPLIASLDATSPRIGLLRAAARARKHGWMRQSAPASDGSGCAHKGAARARGRQAWERPAPCKAHGERKSPQRRVRPRRSAAHSSWCASCRGYGTHRSGSGSGPWA